MSGERSRVSDSELVYNYLLQKCNIGDTFTARTLMRVVTIEGINVTYSALTAFLSRALKREMVAIDSYEKGKIRVYQLMHKQPWEFGPKSVGSLPGRTIHVESKVEQLDPKLAVFVPESLSAQLIEIAAAVELIENKPEKTLADYSNDELAEELRKRMR